MSKTVVANGKYFWELVFSYDNSNNPGEIEHTIKIKKSKKINSRQLLETKFSIKSGFTYKNKSSVSLKFDGVADNSSSVEFSYHLDIAKELTRTAETAEEIIEETEVERKYTVGGKGKLSLYRLCYITEGAITKTDIVATSPQDDVIVDLKFTMTKRILGLSEILDRFRNTHPGSDNILEWRIIRDAIVAVSDEADEKAFRHFVETLSRITPSRDNKAEWAGIRTTCTQILAEWDSTQKQLLFKKLLTRFEATVPGSDNKAEWAAIRQVSHSILNSIRQIF
ncbi:MAG: hypothetical protein F6K36_10790 [Symploca sp. SIO3C6]|nr:hypothetical protein [Symploca sp. SIO3C6]